MGQDPIWLLVDTQKKLIQVKQGSQTLANFENISIGRQGAGHKGKSGDDITPLGVITLLILMLIVILEHFMD